MLPSDDTMLCTKCLRESSVQPKLSFVGFPQFLCPHCNAKVSHPLSIGRKSVLWTLATLLIAGVIWVAAKGQFPFFGLLDVLVIYALVLDLTVTARYRKACRDLTRAPASS